MFFDNLSLIRDAANDWQQCVMRDRKGRTVHRVPCVRPRGARPPRAPFSAPSRKTRAHRKLSSVRKAAINHQLRAFDEPAGAVWRLLAPSGR